MRKMVFALLTLAMTLAMFSAAFARGTPVAQRDNFYLNEKISSPHVSPAQAQLATTTMVAGTASRFALIEDSTALATVHYRHFGTMRLSTTGAKRSTEMMTTLNETYFATYGAWNEVEPTPLK